MCCGKAFALRQSTEPNLVEVTEAALLVDLRVLARDRLRAGVLPRDRAALTLACVPDGTRYCALCDEVITGPLDFRLSFKDRALHFHGRCHDAWLAERGVLQTR